MSENFIKKKRIEPINILIIFLIGIAATLFISGSIDSFQITGDLQKVLIASIAIIYFITVFAFLKPETITEKLPEDRIIEKIQTIESPPEIKEVEKIVVKYKDRPIIKKIFQKQKQQPTKIITIPVEKKRPKKTKYVGSSYNERYHLRSCRFAGAIKKKFLVEENKKKFFELRGYAPCKICHPEKN